MLPINQEVLLHFEAVWSSVALGIVSVVVIVRAPPLPAWTPTLLIPAPCLPGFFILIIAVTGRVQLWHFHHAIVISISSGLLPLSGFLYNQFILQNPKQKTYTPSISSLHFHLDIRTTYIWCGCTAFINIHTANITMSAYTCKRNCIHTVPCVLYPLHPHLPSWPTSSRSLDHWYQYLFCCQTLRNLPTTQILAFQY